MAPALDDLTVFDDQDEISALNGREAVGDDDGRAILEKYT